MTLRIDRIGKSFLKRTVFDGLSAEIGAGNIVALLGANGAGKTTLLRCLSTLSAPTEGEIYMDGEALKRGRLDLRRKLMFLGDFPPLLGETPVQAVAVALRLWQAERRGIEERVVTLFERLGILACTEQQGMLSRGQQYKAALTMLLAVDPELWLLDEPFASGMDPQGINVFREEAAAAASARGRIIIYSTQLVELACGFSDTIGVLKDGQMTLYSTERDLHRDPRKLAALIGEGQGMDLS